MSLPDAVGLFTLVAALGAVYYGRLGDRRSKALFRGSLIAALDDCGNALADLEAALKKRGELESKLDSVRRTQRRFRALTVGIDEFTVCRDYARCELGAVDLGAIMAIENRRRAAVAELQSEFTARQLEHRFSSKRRWILLRRAPLRW